MRPTGQTTKQAKKSSSKQAEFLTKADLFSILSLSLRHIGILL